MTGTWRDGDQPAAAFYPRDTKFVNKFQCSVASERKCDVTKRSVTRNQLITVLNGAMSNKLVPGVHDDVMGSAEAPGRMT